MSFSRLALIALIAGLSAFAINANAASSDQTTTQAAQSSAATTESSASATHHAAREARIMHVRAARIDLNTADEAALAKIKAIGAKKAAIIIAYRAKNGPFNSVEDLKNVTNAKTGRPLFTARSLKALDRHLEVASAANGAAASTNAAGQTQTSTH